MSLPRLQRFANRRNRRQSSSSSRSPLVIPTQRARNGHRPLRERNHDEIVDIDALTDCIDLTSEEDIIDLTSPTQLHPPRAVNDSPVIVVTGRESVSPPLRRRRRTRTHDIENEIEHLDLEQDLPTPDRGNTPEVASPDISVGSSSTGTVQSPGIRRITCPICMDDYKELQQNKVQLMSTVCGHIFCKPCIKAAIRANHQCPSCRKRLTDKQIHPLFL